MHQSTIDFTPIDEAIEKAIKEDKTFPCASILIATSEKVLYKKVFGTMTYESDEKITEDSLFDIASVSKCVATLPAVMKVYEEGKLDLSALVTKYIPEFDNNGKGDITVTNLLIHNSGIPAYKPFYETLKTREEVLNAIYTCEKEYETGTKTVYSCFGFILLAEIVKRLTGGKALEVFCSEQIFTPLGMEKTQFNPPESIRSKIVPTEIDTHYRHKLIQGEVHDETCNLLGGAGGNAGVFSNANDLVKYMQMTLRNGTYVNSQGETCHMFKEETVKKFTACYAGLPYDNSRALGWDTKPKVVGRGPPCGDHFSENCFGHTGFTGTSAWADREKDLIVILLTNRVYPNRDFTQGRILEFRPLIHDKICQLLGYSK